MQRPKYVKRQNYKEPLTKFARQTTDLALPTIVGRAIVNPRTIKRSYSSPNIHCCESFPPLPFLKMNSAVRMGAERTDQRIDPLSGNSKDLKSRARRNSVPTAEVGLPELSEKNEKKESEKKDEGKSEKKGEGKGEKKAKSNWSWNYDLNLIQGSLLGSGSQGNVYSALRPDDGGLLAIKEINIIDLSDREVTSLKQEIELAYELKHPNIVNYYGVKFSPSMDSLTIIMEYLSGGSLHRTINKFGPLPEQVIIKYLLDIALGLEYLHKNNIIHGDLKCNNILLSHKGNCKLADFGSSVIISSRVTTPTDQITVFGTPFWMAPENFQGESKKITQQIDMWSLGATILEMATGKIPFVHLANNPWIFIFHLSQLKSEEDFKFVSDEDEGKLSEQLTKIIKGLLKFDPETRMTSSQLVEYLQQIMRDKT